MATLIMPEQGMSDQKNTAKGQSFAAANVPLLAFMKQCGENIGAVLGGRKDPREIMFPGGSSDAVESVYGATPQSRYYNAILARTIKAAADSIPMDKTMQVLEIGAGTGGTTAAVLPLLPAQRCRYVYTDISPLFTARAKEKFKAYPFVDYQTLDISRDPLAQGCTAGEFDIIICANILHATKDAAAAVRNISTLLRANGLLLLREITVPRPAMGFEISFGCLLDAVQDQDLRGSSPFLTVEGWSKLLRANSFDRFASYPEAAESAFDEHIIIARHEGGAAEAFQTAVQEKKDGGLAMAGEDTGHSLLGRRISSPLVTAQFVSQVSAEKQPFLAQHQVFNIVVVPGTAHFDLAASAARQFFGCDEVQLENVVLREALMLDDGERTVQVLVTPSDEASDESAEFEVFSQSGCSGRGEWHLHVRGTARPAHACPAHVDAGQLNAGGKSVDVAAFYEKFASYGAVQYGPAFRSLRRLWRIETEGSAACAVGEVELDSSDAGLGQGYMVHPALLDSCLQTMVCAMASNGEDELGSDGFMPFSVEKILFCSQVPNKVLCRAVMRDGDSFAQEMFQASFFIYTADGDLVCEIDNLTMRRTNKDTLELLKKSQNAGQRQHLDLCYDIVWRQALMPEKNKAEGSMQGSWLIFAGKDKELCDALALEIAKRGGTSGIVPCAETEPDAAGAVSAKKPEDFERVVGEWVHKAQPQGIFFLWGLDCFEPDYSRAPEDDPTSAPFKTHTAEALLHLAQALGRQSTASGIKLVTLTCQAQGVRSQDQPVPAQSLLWGLEKSIANELGSITPLIVDLDPVRSLKSQLPLICGYASAQNLPEDKLALRGDMVQAPRLVRAQNTARNKKQDFLQRPDAEAWELQVSGGGIERIGIAPSARRTPDAGEVEIAVEAWGMNFRNVMAAMGVSDKVTMLVMDCAGTVTALGAGVTNLSIGDRVLTTAYGHFSSHVSVKASLTAKMPEGMTFAEAAQIPTIFMTSWHALMDVAKLQPGERILIHSAAGGVGLSAIQTAKARGCEIYATAGSERKRALLRSMGIEHVYSSRTAEFADGILAATNGEGVHVVLNFLAGGLADAGMRCLADGGRFVELGKTDVRTDAQAASIRPDIHYLTVDMEKLGQTDEDAMRRIYASVMDGFAKGIFKPIAHRIFTMDSVRSAFRYMLEGRHIGKVVVTNRFVPRTLGIRADASYLISGGFSDLGLALAQHLAQKGAGHLWLIGRHLPEEGSRQAQAAAALAASGCQVHTAAVDVTNFTQLKEFFAAQIAADKVPLAGVFHLAGFLDDDTLLKLDWRRFNSVLSPKADGSWHLHVLTRDLPLDHFVVFSSIASIFGTHGQANHVTANTFMDSLIDARRADFLPGLAVNWGAWAEIGTVVRLGILDRIRQQGVEGFETAAGLAILDSLMEAGAGHKVVTGMNWNRMLPLLQATAAASMYSELGSKTASRTKTQASAGKDSADGGMAEELRALPMAQRDARLRIYLKKEIAGFLRLSPDAVDDDASLTALGMDSLISLDLFQRISKDLKIRIAPHEVSARPNVAAMADKFAHDLGPDVEEDAAEAAADEARLSDLFEADAARAADPFPLSDMQQAYWLGRTQAASSLNGGSCHFYFEAEASGIDIDRYEKAWNILIKRHDMLRCVILDGESQRILESVPPYTIERHDLRGLTAAEQEKCIAELRNMRSHEVLDIAHWPTFRVEASLLSESAIRLHFSFDLTISDFHGISLMMRELEKAYAGEDDKLPALELTFRDYRLAEERYRKTKAWQEDKDYWLRRLDSLPQAPALPLAVSPESLQTQQFSRRSRTISKEVWQKLKERACRRGFTATGITLAAFAEVLGRWSQEPSFTLNMTLFNRLPVHQGVNNIVGEFTSNTLLEVHLDEGGTFETRAGQIWSQLWQDLEHRSFSGVRVLRELGRRKGQAGAAMPVVFTSTLAMDASFSSFSMGLGHEVYSVSQTPQVWLDHQLFEINQELRLIWDCVDELFPEGMLDAMFDTYTAFLEALASDETLWTSPSPIPLPKSQQEVRKAVNSTAEDMPHMLMYQPFLEQAAAHPDAAAVVCGSSVMSYRELEQRSRALAAVLKTKGAADGQPVAVAMEKGWEQVAAVLGIQRAGCAYVPLDIEQPAKRLQQILDDAGINVVLGTSAGKHKLEALQRELILADTLGDEAPDFTEEAQDPASLAYIIYTSGSTGTPKGVMISHQAAMNTILDVNRRFGVTEKDVLLCVSRLSFDLSVYDIFGMLAAGGCLVIPREDEALNPDAWIRAMEEHSVTMWNSVPALGQLLAESLEEKEKLLTSLRLAYFSGDWIPVSLHGRLKTMCPSVRVIAMGGATEASIWSNWHEVVPADAQRTSIPYGTPLANQGFMVLDAGMKHRPDYVPGSLYITGQGLALGYVNDREKTSERFVSHPLTGERLYNTGDMARYLPDGTLEFLGRSDTQVKIHGLRIELGEIEAALKEHPAVSNAAALVHTDKNNAQKLTAFVELDSSAAGLMDEAEAPDQLQALLSDVPDILSGAEHASDLNAAAFKAMWQGLSDLYLAAAARALEELSLYGSQADDAAEFMSRAGIASRYSKWIGRALKALQEHGLLGRDEQGCWQPQGTAPDFASCLAAAKKQLLALGFEPEVGGMLEQTVVHLADILREERHSGEIYTNEAVPALYQKILSLCNQLAAGTAVRAVEKAAGRPFRILEVGAGYGTLTRHILPRLAGMNVRYHFTDISQFFLTSAQKRYAEYGFLDCSIFDLDREPGLQGLEPHSYDMIIAGNVLHDVTDLRRTLSGLKGLLKPAGLMLIMEQVSFQLPLDLAEGLQQGYESANDADMRKEHPILSHEQWRNVLCGQNLAEPAFLMPKDSLEAFLGLEVMLSAGPDRLTAFNAKALDAYMHSRLPGYMVPASFHLLEHMPLTANGKVDRKALLAAAGGGQTAQGDMVPPRTETEAIIAGIWKDLLNVGQVSTAASFFVCGGDSLSAFQLLKALQKTFGQSLSLRDIIQAPTIAEQAKLVLAKETKKHDCLVTLNKADSELTLCLAHPIEGLVTAYARLAAHLPDLSFYALQSLGIDAECEPEHSFQAMVQNYVQALSSLDCSRLLLGGWSMGAFLAWEMAGQKAFQDNHLPLVLLDPPSKDLWDARYGEKRSHTLSLLEQVVPACKAVQASMGLDASSFDKLSEEEQIRLFACGLQSTGQLVHDGPEALESAARILKVGLANVQALWQCRPKPLKDRSVLYIRSAGQPQAGVEYWRALTGGTFTVVEVTSDHWHMLACEEDVTRIAMNIRELAGQSTQKSSL